MKRFISLAAVLLLFAASYAAVTDVSTLSQLANAVSYSSSETTGIEEVPSDKEQSTKVLRNGLLFIERNGETYNAQGHPVPSKH
jgi:hypothetical protein